MTASADTLSDAAQRNGTPPEAAPECPYLGLSFYTEADAPLFFGRDGERQVIMGNLRASRLTLLYAQSGVGKSSLLRAGVAARLRKLAQDALDGAGGAPHVPVVFSAWKDDPTQELIDDILAATNALLGDAHAQFDLPRDSLKSAIDVAVLALDQAVASTGSERAGSTLLIILDQFEEYFLYRAREPRVERFADELAECINAPGLRANFLISIREDAYSALGDLLRGRTSNVYGNYLHLEYLDAKAARAAIEKPVEYFNSTRPEDEQVTIEPGLVEAVLEQVKRDPEEQAGDGHGVAAAAGAHRMEVATPYLQLVMSALWNRERADGSSILRLSTLEELHGAQTIVARHLSQALTELGPAERELAVDVLHHLVTPSGTKIALEVADLSAYTGQSAGRVAGILKALAGPERILREVPPAPGKSGDDERARRYEIYHDVLAAPINDAVAETSTRRLEREKEAAEQRARDEQRRARRFRGLAFAALVLLVAAVVAIVVAEVERHRAARAELTGRSREFAAEAQAGFLSGDLQRGVLMGVQAYRNRSTPDARYALISALEATQDMTAYLAGQKGQISGVAYSPDGRTLASSSVNRTVALWDTASDRQQAVLSTSWGQLTGVTFSPDGASLAASDASGHVILWDARSHAVRRVLAGDGTPIETLAFARGGNLLATARANGSATLWDPASGRSLHTVGSSTQPMYAVAFSPDGKVLITGSGDGGLVLWDTASGHRLRVLRAGGPSINGLAVNPAGTQLAVGTGSSVDVYDLPAGHMQRVLPVNAGQVQAVAFSADGRMLAAGTQQGSNSPATATIWDSSSGQVLRVISAPNALTAINAVAFSPDGGTLASGGTATAGTDSSLTLWNARPLAGFRVLAGPTGAVQAVAFSPNGAQVAATGSDDNVVIWNLGGGPPKVIGLGAGGGQAVAFSPDGRTLAVGGADSSISLWNPATAGSLGKLTGHTDAVFAVAFSPDGRLLASGSADQRVIIWSLSTRKALHRLRGHTDQINAVAFSPDGTRLASAGNDDLINVWDVATGRRLMTLTATRPVAAVAFAPDGRLLASAGADEVVSLWNLATGQLIGTPLAGHQDNVTSLAFSPDGHHLVSGSSDRSALVWDVATGLAAPIGGHTGAITSVAFSPAGNTVASGGADGTIVLAPVPSDLNASAISQRLCRIVRRNLSPVEWRQFIPDEQYQRTCQS